MPTLSTRPYWPFERASAVAAAAFALPTPQMVKSVLWVSGSVPTRAIRRIAAIQPPAEGRGLQRGGDHKQEPFCADQGVQSRHDHAPSMCDNSAI